MATTWNSMTFDFEGGDTLPLYERPLLYAVRPVPYSDASIMDVSGKGESRLRGSIRLSPSDLANWRSSLGAAYTLVVNSVTYSGAVLVGLTNLRQTRHTAYVLADAEWILAS